MVVDDAVLRVPGDSAPPPAATSALASLPTALGRGGVPLPGVCAACGDGSAKLVPLPSVLLVPSSGAFAPLASLCTLVLGLTATRLRAED